VSATTTAARKAPPPKAANKAYCQQDRWEFDPRYTDGACPICGWRPDGAAAAASATSWPLSRVPWDLVTLGALTLFLIFLGVLVGMAAHVNLLPG
jgi:hypothetical protein